MSHEGILVAVNGSPRSDVAVRWAAREAVIRDAQLTIVHVVSLLSGDWSPVALTDGPLPEQVGEWLEDEARQIIQDAIRIARGTAAGDALRIHTEAPCGPVVPVLRDLSKQFAMIVVGSRGQGKLARAMFRSVSTALVNHSHCPVAVVREQLPRTFRHAPVVAFDEACRRNAGLLAGIRGSMRNGPANHPRP
jgi:nucleotide-binding universal stress UspA family protein